MGGELSWYQAWWIAAAQAATHVPGHCHAEALSLWPSTFWDTIGKLLPVDRQASTFSYLSSTIAPWGINLWFLMLCPSKRLTTLVTVAPSTWTIVIYFGDKSILLSAVLISSPLFLHQHSRCSASYLYWEWCVNYHLKPWISLQSSVPFNSS